MKLLVLTCIEDIKSDMLDLLRKSGITAFSESPITGYKMQSKDHHTDEWFAAGGESFSSTLLFSFCSAEVSEKCVNSVQQYIDTHPGPFPPKLALMPVETALF